jgi:hypothetical protein
MLLLSLQPTSVRKIANIAVSKVCMFFRHAEDLNGPMSLVLPAS